MDASSNNNNSNKNKGNTSLSVAMCSNNNDNSSKSNYRSSSLNEVLDSLDKTLPTQNRNNRKVTVQSNVVNKNINNKITLNNNSNNCRNKPTQETILKTSEKRDRERSPEVGYARDKSGLKVVVPVPIEDILTKRLSLGDTVEINERHKIHQKNQTHTSSYMQEKCANISQRTSNSKEDPSTNTPDPLKGNKMFQILLDLDKREKEKKNKPKSHNNNSTVDLHFERSNNSNCDWGRRGSCDNATLSNRNEPGYGYFTREYFDKERRYSCNDSNFDRFKNPYEKYSNLPRNTAYQNGTSFGYRRKDYIDESERRGRKVFPSKSYSGSNSNDFYERKKRNYWSNFRNSPRKYHSQYSSSSSTNPDDFRNNEECQFAKRDPYKSRLPYNPEVINLEEKNPPKDTDEMNDSKMSEANEEKIQDLSSKISSKSNYSHEQPESSFKNDYSHEEEDPQTGSRMVTCRFFSMLSKQQKESSKPTFSKTENTNTIEESVSNHFSEKECKGDLANTIFSEVENITKAVMDPTQHCTVPENFGETYGTESPSFSNKNSDEKSSNSKHTKDSSASNVRIQIKLRTSSLKLCGNNVDGDDGRYSTTENDPKSVVNIQSDLPFEKLDIVTPKNIETNIQTTKNSCDPFSTTVSKNRDIDERNYLNSNKNFTLTDLQCHSNLTNKKEILSHILPSLPQPRLNKYECIVRRYLDKSRRKRQKAELLKSQEKEIQNVNPETQMHVFKTPIIAEERCTANVTSVSAEMSLVQHKCDFEGKIFNKTSNDDEDKYTDDGRNKNCLNYGKIESSNTYSGSESGEKIHQSHNIYSRSESVSKKVDKKQIYSDEQQISGKCKLPEKTSKEVKRIQTSTGDTRGIGADKMEFVDNSKERVLADMSIIDTVTRDSDCHDDLNNNTNSIEDKSSSSSNSRIVIGNGTENDVIETSNSQLLNPPSPQLEMNRDHFSEERNICVSRSSEQYSQNYEEKQIENNNIDKIEFLINNNNSMTKDEDVNINIDFKAESSIECQVQSQNLNNVNRSTEEICIDAENVTREVNKTTSQQDISKNAIKSFELPNKLSTEEIANNKRNEIINNCNKNEQTFIEPPADPFTLDTHELNDESNILLEKNSQITKEKASETDMVSINNDNCEVNQGKRIDNDTQCSAKLVTQQLVDCGLQKIKENEISLTSEDIENVEEHHQHISTKEEPKPNETAINAQVAAIEGNKHLLYSSEFPANRTTCNAVIGNQTELDEVLSVFDDTKESLKKFSQKIRGSNDDAISQDEESIELMKKTLLENGVIVANQPLPITNFQTPDSQQQQHCDVAFFSDPESNFGDTNDTYFSPVCDYSSEVTICSSEVEEFQTECPSTITIDNTNNKNSLTHRSKSNYIEEINSKGVLANESQVAIIYDASEICEVFHNRDQRVDQSTTQKKIIEKRIKNKQSKKGKFEEGKDKYRGENNKYNAPSHGEKHNYNVPSYRERDKYNIHSYREKSVVTSERFEKNPSLTVNKWGNEFQKDDGSHKKYLNSSQKRQRKERRCHLNRIPIIEDESGSDDGSEHFTKDGIINYRLASPRKTKSNPKTKKDGLLLKKRTPKIIDHGSLSEQSSTECSHDYMKPAAKTKVYALRSDLREPQTNTNQNQEREGIEMRVAVPLVRLEDSLNLKSTYFLRSRGYLEIENDNTANESEIIHTQSNSFNSEDQSAQEMDKIPAEMKIILSLTKNKGNNYSSSIRVQKSGTSDEESDFKVATDAESDHKKGESENSAETKTQNVFNQSSPKVAEDVQFNSSAMIATSSSKSFETTLKSELQRIIHKQEAKKELNVTGLTGVSGNHDSYSEELRKIARRTKEKLVKYKHRHKKKKSPLYKIEQTSKENILNRVYLKRISNHRQICQPIVDLKSVEKELEEIPFSDNSRITALPSTKSHSGQQMVQNRNCGTDNVKHDSRSTIKPSAKNYSMPKRKVIQSDIDKWKNHFSPKKSIHFKRDHTSFLGNRLNDKSTRNVGDRSFVGRKKHFSRFHHFSKMYDTTKTSISKNVAVDTETNEKKTTNQHILEKKSELCVEKESINKVENVHCRSTSEDKISTYHVPINIEEPNIDDIDDARSEQTSEIEMKEKYEPEFNKDNNLITSIDEETLEIALSDNCPTKREDDISMNNQKSTTKNEADGESKPTEIDTTSNTINNAAQSQDTSESIETSENETIGKFDDEKEIVNDNDDQEDTDKEASLVIDDVNMNKDDKHDKEMIGDCTYYASKSQQSSTCTLNFSNEPLFSDEPVREYKQSMQGRVNSNQVIIVSNIEDILDKLEQESNANEMRLSSSVVSFKDYDIRTSLHTSEGSISKHSESRNTQSSTTKDAQETIVTTDNTKEKSVGEMASEISSQTLVINSNLSLNSMSKSHTAKPSSSMDPAISMPDLSVDTEECEFPSLESNSSTLEQEDKYKSNCSSEKKQRKKSVTKKKVKKSSAVTDIKGKIFLCFSINSSCFIAINHKKHFFRYTKNVCKSENRLQLILGQNKLYAFSTHFLFG